ncbi:Methyltransferase [Actinidia chinensis var. chinensis]|uniref:Methyltransferase n=1 Tax=Actinidia chinensis var. chinensis TaxID=1590841 RepID=A0A2R6QXB0_ACTCC|nr:Methyltransferase [Actinidia chinensis var. chinensis]
MDAPTERHCYKPTLRWNPKVEDYFIKAYGRDHFACISEALTSASCYSCIRVNTLKLTSDAIIERLSAILQEAGQHYVIGNMNQTDANGEYIIGCEHNDHVKESHVPPNSYDFDKAALALYESAQNGQITKCQLPGLDYVVFVKGSGPHTINYGCAQDKPHKEVIVSRKCAEAVLRGAQVYVPGVLACSAHVEKGDTVAVSVAVEQLGQDGGWGIGMTREAVLQGLQTVDPYFFERNGLYIGQGTTMMSRAQMFRVPEGIAVDLNDRVFKLPSFHDVLEGEIFLQNLPSIITAHALDPQQGERILDMCAAPGGKTTPIAILMKDQGEVVAVDRSHNKVAMKKQQKRLALPKLNCGRVSGDLEMGLEEIIVWVLGLKNQMVFLQIALIEFFSMLLVLLLVWDPDCLLERCTINPGENEALVRYALDTYKFLTLALQHPRIGGPGLVGGCELSDGCIEEWLKPGEEELVQRFDPSSPLDTIGFFIAKFNVGSKDA